jgi:stage V sporulation protein SpoVS
VLADGYDLYGVPTFVDLVLSEEERTGIRLDIYAVKK